MIFSVVIDLIKSLLPSILLALFGLLLLRKLEEIKTNVARHSDFSQKWAALFFDAANAFMSSAEYILSRLIFLVSSKGVNDKQGHELAQKINSELHVLLENRFRIQRQAQMAPQKGSAADKKRMKFSKLFDPALIQKC